MILNEQICAVMSEFTYYEFYLRTGHVVVYLNRSPTKLTVYPQFTLKNTVVHIKTDSKPLSFVYEREYLPYETAVVSPRI